MYSPPTPPPLLPPVLTVRDSAWVSVLLAASVTLAVKLDVPVAVGVPEITPAALRDSPDGSVPLERMLHVYGVVPPVAASVVV